MKNKQIELDSKDFLLILELAFSVSKNEWTYQTMAAVLGLSPSQVHGSAGKLLASGLLNGKGLKGKVNREALADFVIHGARYVFPPVKGAPCRGILTGASSDLFDAQKLAAEDDIPWVWPSSRGEARGTSLAPVHPCVPEAILHDPSLHEALVYFDALRVGGAREREAAEAFFRRRLAWGS